MYVVTFYSFKGGVGRTSALMNVAVALAKAGKRVLLVDFDLEAPGLYSYPMLREAIGKPGVVEYITEYLKENVAPRADGFVFECKVDERAIWIMPAGNVHDSAYSGRLGSINWELLYKERDGYLLFEDLKQQWSEYGGGAGFDYVLIDSRTGHTDIGGICTRQLPDAVVAMFLPTQQNIDGLVPVVEAIREEAIGGRRKKIALHFCPSNVPNLDDEKLILSEILNKARLRLGYATEASRVHHYNSMDLLNETIFTLSRPGTSLAKEYQQLKDNVIAKNVEDREGALTALRTALDTGVPGVAYARVVDLKLDEIQLRHGSDPEVASDLAQAFALIGDDERQLAHLDVVLGAELNRPRTLIRRAICLRRLGRNEESLLDWVRVLREPGVSGAEILRAVNGIRELRPNDWVRSIQSSLQAEKLGVEELRQVVKTLMSTPESVSFGVSLMERSQFVKAGLPAANPTLDGSYVLSLIRMHRFEDAIKAIGSRAQVIQGERIIDVFNYAIAEWGRDARAPKDLFQRVVELDRIQRRSMDANYHQCMALANAVAGNSKEATKRLERARQDIEVSGRAFSCWSYLELSRAEFLRDVTAMTFGFTLPLDEFRPGFFSKPSDQLLI